MVGEHVDRDITFEAAQKTYDSSLVYLRATYPTGSDTDVHGLFFLEQRVCLRGGYVDGITVTHESGVATGERRVIRVIVNLLWGRVRMTCTRSHRSVQNRPLMIRECVRSSRWVLIRAEAGDLRVPPRCTHRRNKGLANNQNVLDATQILLVGIVYLCRRISGVLPLERALYHQWSAFTAVPYEDLSQAGPEVAVVR